MEMAEVKSVHQNEAKSEPQIGTEPDIDNDSLEGDSINVKSGSSQHQNSKGEISNCSVGGTEYDKQSPFPGGSGYDHTLYSPPPVSDSLDSLSQSNSSTNEASELTFLLSAETPEDKVGNDQTEQKSRLPVKCTTGSNRKSSLPTQKNAKDILQKGKRKVTKSKTLDLSKGVLCQDDKKRMGRGESLTCLSTSENHGVRETVTSRMRFEKRHVIHDQECEGEEYVTPTQRKEHLLKDLKIQVKDLTGAIEEKDHEIERLKQDIDKEAQRIIREKNEAARELKSDLDGLQTEHDDLKLSYQKSLLTIVNTEETVAELQERIALQDKKNESIYLEMYKKGQESAQFERNVELERLAVGAETSSMTMNELIRKLVTTESELAKWQSFRRQESYETAEKPETQADVTLRFLKDSFYHYLTDTKESDRHLRAMIRIFKFTDVQKKKISSCLTERKNRNP